MRVRAIADFDIARRYDRRDRVLVNHLTDGIAQQNHELIEGFDGALQLDAVDQIDRNRDAFAAQGVQEGSCKDWALDMLCSRGYDQEFHATTTLAVRRPNA